jgi:PAS domain S-box-containing protein
MSKPRALVRSMWNKAAEAMFGYAEIEMIDHPITAVIPPDRIEEERMILDRVRRGERINHFETER